MLLGERANEDATRGRPGRTLRDVAFVVTTNQNFDQFSTSDVYRDTRGLLAGWTAVLAWSIGVPLVLYGLLVLYAGYRFGMRAYAFAPAMREDGARHVLVLFAADGFLHRAEYIRGRGEVVSVLTDGHGPIPAAVSHQARKAIERAHWGEQSSPDRPRELVRVVQTYRRRRAGWFPFVWYARTSAGFAAHVLGVPDARIRTPKQLADWCEREAMAEEARPSEVMQGA